MEKRDWERERLREQMGEEERDQGRERVRRRRESSYYKWQSLPWAYDKCLSALPGIRVPSEPLNCCHNGKVSLPSLGDYLSLQKDLFTGSNIAESSNFQDNIRQYNSAFSFTSFKLICPLVHHGNIIHQGHCVAGTC